MFTYAAVGYSAWGILLVVILTLAVIQLLPGVPNPILANGLTSHRCPSCVDSIVECRKRPEERGPHKTRV